MTVTLDRDYTPAPPPTEVAPSTPTPAEVRTHAMYVCGGEVQRVVTWTPGQPCEQAAAEVFAERRACGDLAYETTGPGEHVTMHAFNPDAATITLTRPVQGG